MKKLIYMLALVMLVSGCATSYKKCGLMGGYTDTKLQDDVFKVSFKGNAFIERDKTEDFALLRCAELALDNGYKYFVVTDEKSYVKTGTYTTPQTAQTYGTINTYGNSGTYSGTTSYSGGQTYMFNKPRSELIIKCFKEKPADTSAMVFDAEQLKTNLKQQYKIK